MTLIRKSLYKELVEVRDEILSNLNKTKESLSVVSAKLSTETDFVNNFDKTQSDLQASANALKDSESKLTEALTALKQKSKQLDEIVNVANDERLEAQEDFQQQEEILSGLIEENASAEDIAEQQKVVNTASAVAEAKAKTYKEAVANLEANNASQADIATQRATTIKSIEEIAKQQEDNIQREKDSADYIAELTSSKNEATEEVAKLQNDYDTFIAKNKETIDTFEKQQLQRDANVPKTYGSTDQVFYRTPENSTVINEADTVLKGVIDDELKPASAGEAEQLEQYITAGAEESINPDFLTAEKAKNLSLSVIWSTRTVARQIKKACMNGDFSTKCGSLPNSVIYALQQAGYKMYLTDATNDRDASIIITWENLSSKEESKGEK